MRTFQAWAALLALLASGWVAASDPLPPDQFGMEPLPARTPHWIYVVDSAFMNETDSRVRLYDADTHGHLGQIDAGFFPAVTLSPDRNTMVVGTTYFARGGHGERTDVVEFTDMTTLALTGEIVLPAKRAQATPTYLNLGYSSDSRFLYVAYITPAASFGVLDPASRKVLGEIDTAGCVLVIPWGPDHVSSICDSGRLLTVTLDPHGNEASRALSDMFFDVETDPLFVQGIPSDQGYTFLSFLGKVHEVDFSGAEPVFHAPWSLVSAAEAGHWRPGGQQLGAIQRRMGRLYVAMHRGGEGSHKKGGTEIWVFDLGTHRRIARWPVAPLKLAPVTAVQVSQDEAPLLFLASDSNAAVATLDALTGQLRHVDRNLGQTPWQILNP
jgi:methylamine dehydrogenase heavy chain